MHSRYMGSCVSSYFTRKRKNLRIEGIKWKSKTLINSLDITCLYQTRKSWNRMMCSAEYTGLPFTEIVPCLKVVSNADPKRYCDSVFGAIMVGICGRLFWRWWMSCRFADTRIEGTCIRWSEFLPFIVKILQWGMKQSFSSPFPCMMECEAF